ncbi:transcriptional regulator [Aureimonas sp. AU40]|uniref:transcriptional regulator n=1 Tax=Aureimonas sp. AU40 TaxID=1637747 RepID=UPI000784ED99|nr:transcriptional regulator [Aureimonas sp. AU40]
MARTPKVDKPKSRIASYIEKKIDAIAAYKSQKDIAEQAGYENPSIISMFKRGDAKVPLDRVYDLAKVIEADPRYMFRLALEQYWSGKNIDEAFANIFGTIVSANEVALLETVRKAANDADPVFTSAQLEQIAAVVSGGATKAARTA